jgi:hypothetical protein
MSGPDESYVAGLPFVDSPACHARSEIYGKNRFLEGSMTEAISWK